MNKIGNWPTYITGFVVGGAATEMAMPEPRTLDKGLIFVKDTNILLSGDKWTVVVNIALDDYDALAHTLKIMLKQIRQQIRVIKNPKSYGFDVYWDVWIQWFRDLTMIYKVLEN